MRKTLEKQIKTVEDQGKKQLDALKDLKPKEQRKPMDEMFSEGYESLEIKKTSIETIWFIIQARNHLNLEYLKQ